MARDLYTRFVLTKEGEWIAMQVNLYREDVNTERRLDFGEVDQAWIPNRLAVELFRAPTHESTDSDSTTGDELTLDYGTAMLTVQRQRDDVLEGE